MKWIKVIVLLISTAMLHCPPQQTMRPSITVSVTLKKELPKRGTYATPEPEIMVKLQKPHRNAKGKGVK